MRSEWEQQGLGNPPLCVAGCGLVTQCLTVLALKQAHTWSLSGACGPMLLFMIYSSPSSCPASTCRSQRKSGTDLIPELWRDLEPGDNTRADGVLPPGHGMSATADAGRVRHGRADLTIFPLCPYMTPSTHPGGSIPRAKTRLPVSTQCPPRMGLGW